MTFPELRASARRGQLPYEASRMLERALPHMRRDDWDMNKRMLFALHRLQMTVPAPANALVRANLSEDEKDLVLYGPKEDSKKSGLFWWL